MSYPKDLNTFCTLPFVHICNRIDGKFLACCHAEGTVTDDDGSPFEIQKGHTFKQVYESSYMQTLRQNMLNGVRDKRCKLCWKLEDLGLNSKRLHDGNRYLRKTLERLNDDATQFAPLSWDIKLGTLCNLKCRMCNPHTSIALMNEAIANGWHNKQDGQLHAKETKDFLQYPEFKKELISLLSSAEEIYFLGGEPTLIDSHLEILDHAISSGYAKNIVVRWSTNLSYFDDRYIQRASHFKKVILDCSVDGFGEINDYIRYPSKWQHIESQLFKIRKNLTNAYIKIVCTVQIYNIFEIEKFLSWCGERNYVVAFNFLDHPEYLSTQNLPSSVKEILIEKYAKSDNSQLRELSRWLSLESEQNGMDVFWRETRKLDIARKQNFENLIPDRMRPLMFIGDTGRNQL